MRSIVERAGLSDAIAVSSAGTGAWHVGELPDPRSRATAKGRGVELLSRARLFEAESFDDADYVIAMDGSNFKNLHGLARNDADRSKIAMLRDFDATVPKGSQVPDPYAGGPEGFENVFDMIELASEGLLEHLRARHGLA